jgi:EAL domain-containing protein (putative c-di-GMP-specific phosphodiesterase class I)
MAGTLQKPFRLDRLRRLLGRFLPRPRPSLDELAEAIDGHQLFLEYQPKVDCRRGLVSGVEALVRWQHPERGRLSPEEFIPMAEDSGLIEPLTDWVFGTAVEQAAAWRGAGLTLDVAINISARNLVKADLPDRFAKHCDEFGVDLDTIILEITESSAMHDALHALEVLTRLRVKGFRLAMDDFGTAHSSLVQLQRMPFSELKIDQSFVIDMAHNHSCEVITRIVTDLARNLGLRSVAEGVEDEQTWEALQAMGCDAAQGYHLSHPIPADQIGPLIQRGVRETALPD